MTDAQFARRAEHILHNMALERTGWARFFSRWFISHEPLRNDAANLLRESNRCGCLMPNGARLVGDDDRRAGA